MGSLSPARPLLPLNFPARAASQPGSPSPPQLYKGERFGFSTRRAKSKMRNKASLGLPSPCLPRGAWRKGESKPPAPSLCPLPPSTQDTDLL